MSESGNNVELVGFVAHKPVKDDRGMMRFPLRRRYEYFAVVFTRGADVPCNLSVGDRVRIVGRLEVLSNEPGLRRGPVGVRGIRIERWIAGRWRAALQTFPCPPAPRWGSPTGLA